jgi:hypothetical protein
MLKLADFLITILINGFNLVSVKRISTDSTIINIKKKDKFGAIINYSILLSIKGSNHNLIDILNVSSKELNSTPIIVSNTLKSDKIDSYQLDEFRSIIGGFTNMGLILIPNLPDILDALGFNRLPTDLDGKADDLLEIYIKECLQYLLFSPARRYGQERLFESLPDGIIIGKDRMIIQYDTKACKDGFKFSADDIERFAKYVNDFNSVYESFLGKVYCFLVVSGKINDSIDSIQRRADVFYSRCQTQLCCIDCREFGNIIKMIRHNYKFRPLINWKKLFTNKYLSIRQVEEEIKSISKDNLI